MLKRFSLALAGLFAFVGMAGAAGTLPGFSLATQFDNRGELARGCKLYIIQAGTVSTPQDSFQDSDLSIKNPNPLSCDAGGRLPQFFLADGQIKVRLVDNVGVQIFSQDNLLVVGPSSGGGGGGGGVDPTTVFQTGDVLWSETAGPRVGWVRDNGRTIGSASSGATERANADVEALFGWLWQNCDDTKCPVAGGRGVSSSADWAANKTIATPDKRGYIIGGLDDMGNSAAGRFAGVPVVSGSVTTAGSVIGEALHTLATDEIPAHTHANTLTDPGHVHVYNRYSQLVSLGTTVTGSGSFWLGVGDAATDTRTTGITITNASTGGGGAHNNVQKTVLGTFYRKL
jgi:microcystin-dependent protein